MNSEEPYTIQWNGYIYEPRSNIFLKNVTQTMDERVWHIFELLNVQQPTDIQKRFVQLEVKKASEQGNFKKLVFFTAGCMGKLDSCYDRRYILKPKE